MSQQHTRVLNIIGLLSLLLAGSLVFSLWQKSNSVNAENNRQYAQLQGLELEGSMLERALDSLAITCRNLRLENEDLHGRAVNLAGLIAAKDAAIKKLSTPDQPIPGMLRVQVEELRRIKIEYETIIAAIQSENEHLRVANGQLGSENAQLRDENTDLNGQMDRLARQLAEQIRKTRSARFKATSFRVEVVRKSDRLTARARKAREIYITFDLAEVPESDRSVQKLYLSVTDERGRPVLTQNPIKTTVQSPTGPVAVIAQEVKRIRLQATQRLSFSYRFDERLQSGHYVAAIYGETGLLGAASFRLF